MKTGNGFVSNSSTTSFICDVCDEMIAGRDMCIDDAEMFKCENGHTVCDSHAIVPKNKSFWEILEDSDEDRHEARYKVSKDFCPLCQMQKVSKKDLAKYYDKEYRQKKEVIKEIQGRFKTYEEFTNFVE